MSIGEQSVPMLHGLLADHGAVTLLNCQFGGMTIGRTSTHRLRVGEALTGVWLDAPSEAFLRLVEVDLPALEALLGPYPVRPTRRLSGRSRHVSLTLDKRHHLWREDDVEIAWEYQWSTSIGTTSTSVSMSPTLVLSSRMPRSLGYWIEEWLVPINQLLTVLTGAKSNPRSVSAWTKKNLTPAEKASMRIPVWMRGVGDHDYAYDPHRVLARVTAIANNPDGLPDVVRRTRQLSSEQEVFLGLLSGVINYSDRSLRNRYLDLAAALEAYHSQVHGVGPIAPDAFKTKRKNALDAVTSAGIAGADRKFINRWLLTRASYSLDTRLHQLATEAGLFDKWTLQPSRMGTLRNDVAHGNAGVDATDLNTAYEQAFGLARQLVLRQLAIDTADSQ